MGEGRYKYRIREEKEEPWDAGLELKHTHTSCICLLKEQSSNDISVEISVPNFHILVSKNYSPIKKDQDSLEKGLIPWVVQGKDDIGPEHLVMLKSKEILENNHYKKSTKPAYTGQIQE